MLMLLCKKKKMKKKKTYQTMSEMFTQEKESADYAETLIITSQHTYLS